MNLLEEISQKYRLSLPEDGRLSLENPTKIFNPDKEGVKIVSEYATKLGLSVLPQENGHIIVAKGLERFTFLMFKFDVSTYKRFHGIPISLLWNILRQFSAKSTFIFIRSDKRLLHKLKFNRQAGDDIEKFAVEIKAARWTEDGSLDWHPIGQRLEELINPFYRQLEMEERKSSDGTFLYGSTGDYGDEVKSKQILWKTGLLSYLEDVLESISKDEPVKVNLDKEDNLFSYDGLSFVEENPYFNDDEDEGLEAFDILTGKSKFKRPVRNQDTQERIMAVEQQAMKLARLAWEKSFYKIEDVSGKESYDLSGFRIHDSHRGLLEVKGRSAPFIDSQSNFIMTVNEVLLSVENYDTYHLALVAGIRTVRSCGAWKAYGGTVYIYQDYYPGKELGIKREEILKLIRTLNQTTCYPIKFRPIVNIQDSDEVYTEEELVKQESLTPCNVE